MTYRKDIDGLRAFAVLSVIAFHTGLAVFPGGYVGVDIFFVISGYIITTMICSEIKNKKFSYLSFYKRRIARLLPSLIITLLIVASFGFYFYTNKSFDKLGKEMFFSSIGAANILFAQGVDYFAEDAAYQPLMHLWSLGVEEQFYLIWPAFLLIAFKMSHGSVIPLTAMALVTTTIIAISVVNNDGSKAYFLLQYRANELLIGSLTALILTKASSENVREEVKKSISYFGLVLMAAPVFLYDENTVFPGYNALFPCLGVALIIAFPNTGWVTRLLSHRTLVFVGLISYPLYLYHQPIVSFISYFDFKLPASALFMTVAFLSSLLALVTYQYVEKPIRNIARIASRKSIVTVGMLCFSIPALAAAGAVIAKTNGLPERFELLNPFALEVSASHASSFHKHYERGFEVSESESSKALFVGDSVLQQYVLPISIALDFDVDEVDTVTRGGCVLLKGVDFNDKYADISCNDIRNDLYNSAKTYDYVVISQAWESYEDSVTNFPAGENVYERWSGFLNQTVEHFLRYSEKVVIVGPHPRVAGVKGLQPSIRLTKETYLFGLRKLEVINNESLNSAVSVFNALEKNRRIIVLEPREIFCSVRCVLSNETWSYYSDGQHLTSAATSFVAERISNILSLRANISP